MCEKTIPQIVHYCWFGGKEKPEAVVRCMDSWKKWLPEYQFIEWNESNFNIAASNVYVREAYEAQKWAFVSDYVRLHALKTYGGIYLDTDVEVFRSFNELLEDEAFLGFESKDYLTTAVMACCKGSWIIDDFIGRYENRHFILPDGSLDTDTTNVVVLTRMMKERGLVLNGKAQTVAGVRIYPQKYFSPNDLCNVIGKYKKSNFTYHHCYASWYRSGTPKGILGRLRHYFLGIAKNLIGTANLYHLKHPNYENPLIGEHRNPVEESTDE